MGTDFILLIASVVLLAALGVFILKRQGARGDERALEDLFTKIRDEIRFSIQPMGDIPIGVEEITDLAVEVWKIEQRLSKASEGISDVHMKGLNNSIQRLKKYLLKFDVEIQDYTGQKYNDGFNFDVLSREQDSSLEFPIIKETVEPTVTCRGRVVKKAKVILASNQT